MQPRVLLAALASTSLTATGGAFSAYQTGLIGPGRHQPTIQATAAPPETVATTREIVDYVTTPADQPDTIAMPVPMTAPPTTAPPTNAPPTNGGVPTNAQPSPNAQLVAATQANPAAAAPSTVPRPSATSASARPAPTGPQEPATSSPPLVSPRVPPATSTTTSPPGPGPSAPTTTWPRGTEIPDDWPPGRPIPPIPAGCEEPELEDSGVWDCDD